MLKAKRIASDIKPVGDKAEHGDKGGGDDGDTDDVDPLVAE